MNRRSWDGSAEQREESARQHRVLLQREYDANAIHGYHQPAPVFDEFSDVDMSGYVAYDWSPLPDLPEPGYHSDGMSHEDILAEQAFRDADELRRRREYATRQRNEAAMHARAEAERRRRQARIERWADREQEAAFDTAIRENLIVPFDSILPKGGRVWSAEVEIDGLTPQEAAAALGVESGQYSIRPDTPSVVAASDSSVDAEVKVSCMRDGAGHHAEYARRTYATLTEQGAQARSNCGHHVHIDATRVADAGAVVLVWLSPASRVRQ